MNIFPLNLQVNSQAAGCLTGKFIRVLQMVQADSAACALAHRAEHIHRGEQRYLVDDIEPLWRQLLAHGAPQEYVLGRPETEITTIYLDTPQGTWSVGNSSVKFRCRSYQDPQLWWFEMKRRANATVDKWRQAIATTALPALVQGEQRWEALKSVIGQQALLPLITVRYWRTAFEWPDLRVTLDRDVAFYTVSPNAPHLLGKKMGGVRSYIVEVKPSAHIPDWLANELRHYPLNPLSKSKRALECLAHAI